MKYLDSVSIETACLCYERCGVYLHCEDGHVVFAGIEEIDNKKSKGDMVSWQE